MSDNSPEKFDELVNCYGLPFGIFGIFCWCITTLGIILIHKNISLFTPWKWDEPHESQNALFLIIESVMIIGPVIYTCTKCRTEWEIVLMAIGHLTTWGFAIINDGIRSNYMARSDPDQGYFEHSKNLDYVIFGGIVGLLSICGWIGTTGLFARLIIIEAKSSIIICLCITYLTVLTAFTVMTVIICCFNEGGRRKFVIMIIMAYILLSFHIIGSHVILAIISDHWSGISQTRAGLTSSIIFFVGECLLFLNI